MNRAVFDTSAFLHPQAVCETGVGEGTRVWAFAHIMPDACVGRECNIGEHVFIESGVRIGDRVTIKNHAMLWKGVHLQDDVFVGPGVVFTNDRYPRSLRMPEIAALKRTADSIIAATAVRRGATIGAGAIVVAGVTIGEFAMIGAGAVVTRSVCAHRLVVGHPARPIGWVCLCGRRVESDEPCGECGRRWRVECDSLIAVE